mgnify:CR=1 FL=1
MPKKYLKLVLCLIVLSASSLFAEPSTKTLSSVDDVASIKIGDTVNVSVRGHSIPVKKLADNLWMLGWTPGEVRMTGVLGGATSDRAEASAVLADALPHLVSSLNKTAGKIIGMQSITAKARDGHGIAFAPIGFLVFLAPQ